MKIIVVMLYNFRPKWQRAKPWIKPNESNSLVSFRSVRLWKFHIFFIQRQICEKAQNSKLTLCACVLSRHQTASNFFFCLSSATHTRHGALHSIKKASTLSSSPTVGLPTHENIFYTQFSRSKVRGRDRTRWLRAKEFSFSPSLPTAKTELNTENFSREF